ncbi:hypothetical protein [Aerosakkonema funiforme]|uniref:hypothetical protein n=1 Tax=Aerosakkonema funiforme TaxID=1246630 RepID=UPI0035B6ACD1
MEKIIISGELEQSYEIVPCNRIVRMHITNTRISEEAAVKRTEIILEGESNMTRETIVFTGSSAKALESGFVTGNGITIFVNEIDIVERYIKGIPCLTEDDDSLAVDKNPPFDD